MPRGTGEFSKRTVSKPRHLSETGRTSDTFSGGPRSHQPKFSSVLTISAQTKLWPIFCACLPREAKAAASCHDSKQVQ